MRRFQRVAALIALLMVPVIGFTGCGDKGSGGKASNAGGGGGDGKGPITIGVAGPMTGSGAPFGEMIKMASELKVKEINDAGGINGRMIKLIIKDDKGQTKDATNVAVELAGNPEVSIVIGHFNSNCSNASKKEYNKKGVVQFSPGSTNVAVCEGFPWTFRNLYRDDYQGTFLAHYAKKKLMLKRVAICYEEDDYGRGLKDAFEAEAKKIGLEIVAQKSYVRERTTDFKAALISIKDTNPDGLFLSGLFGDAALIAKMAKTDLKMDVKLLGGDGVIDGNYIKIAGPAAAGTFLSTPFLFNTGNDSEAAKKFMTDFQAAYKVAPNTWAALTYDAVGQAIEAIKAVGTDRKKIKEYFAECTTAEKGYQGVTGNTYFNDDGDCMSKPAFVTEVKDGKFMPAKVQLSADEMK